ncbi:MAG: hypothetical protein DMD28_11490 [Gemmatimonadetes bacterium]|nr:MAG: hypothetical protein DMD28_11490 [Gemmatimonadota bacterium]
MTQTGARLRQLGLAHTRARISAFVLAAAGLALAIAALGLWLAPRPLAVVAAWLAIALVAGLAAWGARRAPRGADPHTLGRLVEGAAGARDGSVVGALAAVDVGLGGTSAELASFADARAARVVAAVASRVDRSLARETRRRVAAGVIAAAAGAALFVVASPARGRAAFWHPLRTLADARATVLLAVDRDTVRRGEGVTVTIAVPAATRATLWTRAPGEPWRPLPVPLDTSGRGMRRLGPLETDLYVRATSGTRRSAEHTVVVRLPAFLADLELTARYPAYLQRADEQIVAGPDTIPLPAGTAVLTNGAASVPVVHAAWVQSPGGRNAARLGVRGTAFSGGFVPGASGVWRLEVAAGDGSPLEGDAPELHLRVVPDSAPVVFIPVPGRDTTLPLSLRQPVVIDVRDDHGVSRVELVSWRVSRTGKVAEPVRQALDVSGAGDRALLQGELDAERRGLLPGDTLRLRVDAWDNAPRPHEGSSVELALRLLSLEELRAATRAAAREIGATADSLTDAAGAVLQRTSDLAQERSRDAATPDRRPAGAQAGTLPFEASERAAAIAQQQAEVEQRAQQLAQAVAEVARAAQQAGLTDTAFQARLAEVQQLLQRALTPELEQRLRELQEALAKLDPEAMRQALANLAEAQRQLKETLARSQELFRRAAVEGALQSLAADAEDLRRRQAEWNEADARRVDSSATERERALAARTDSLARGIAQAASDLARAAPPPDGGTPLAAPRAAAARAHGAMRRAAGAASERDATAAASAGAAAESALAEIPDALRARRDSLAQAWRRETLDALDRALSETVALAERQRQIAEALHRSEAGPATRSQQASLEEGADAVERQVRAAAGRHALVSPQLERALAFAQRQMRAARERLEEANPNVEAAAALAEESVDALNATAYALAKSRNDVQGGQSGSGFAEMMEQLAHLAQQQGGLNGEVQGLLSFAAATGGEVMDQLRALAAQQRALAEDLERLHGEGASQAAGTLAQEARDLARQLEAGRLDAQTIQRQERLYRRLLDAGRTLTGPEPDEQRERASRPASSDSVHVPALLAPGATGAGARVRYPRWDELRDLTPEQRRLVLEYFRRLNAPSAPASR